MKKSVYTHLRHLVAGLLCLSLVTISYAQGGFSDATKARLQHVIDSFITQSSPAFVGGMSVAINVDGLALWEGAGGYRGRTVDANNVLTNVNDTPFTVNTYSRIYSITKTFTAPLVLQLVKEGKISLEKKITDYIPMLNYINPGLNPNVTVKQLLSHESGYSDYVKEDTLQVFVAMHPDSVLTPYHMLYFVHQERAPGVARRYSSTNYVLLGAIIEVAVPDKTVQQLLKERFFEPLGLSSMSLSVREPDPSPLASPHEYLGMLNPFFPGGITFPNAYTNVSRLPFTGIASLAFTGGGIISNVTDVSKWGNALFGGRATDPDILNTMMQSISDTADPDGDFLGYGFWRSTQISERDNFIGHNGNAPGYRTAMFYQPERKMTIAVLTNYGGAKVYDISKALYKVLPNFIAGSENRKEAKIILCHNGKTITVAWEAADVLIKNGATLGACEDGKDKKAEGKKPADVLSAYPNPASGNVTISFTPVVSGRATLTLHNSSGNLVSTLFNGMVEKGTMKQLMLSSGKLMPGTYYCHLQTPNGTSEQKLLIVR